jgi:hypothetical protein
MMTMAIALKEDWEFNILNVYNFRKPGPLEGYFTFVKENHAILPGDLLEAGVFRGRSLLGMAMLLKELGSHKKIYGYDTWSGFPPIYAPEDELEKWEELYRAGRISEQHFEKTKLQVSHRTLGASAGTRIDSSNISMSGDFSSCTRSDLEAKIAYLGLDNIVLAEGDFAQTMVATKGPSVLMAALIDADLYNSYKVALPYIWPRLTRGGYLYLDEYYSLKFPGARIACDEYFADCPDKPQPHDNLFGDFERWYVRKIFDSRSTTKSITAK